MTPKFLLFARRLALLSPTLVSCASSPPPAAPPIAPPPAPSSAATSAPSEACRCSWDSDANAAPRVCKKGEVNYAGAACVPQSHPKYPDMVEGPLPPPDLPSA